MCEQHASPSLLAAGMATLSGCSCSIWRCSGGHAQCNLPVLQPCNIVIKFQSPFKQSAMRTSCTSKSSGDCVTMIK